MCVGDRGDSKDGKNRFWCWLSLASTLRGERRTGPVFAGSAAAEPGNVLVMSEVKCKRFVGKLK